MKMIYESLGSLLVMSTILAVLSGCGEQEGPAEEAGKKIDNAAEQAGQQMEKAGDAIQDAAREDKQ